MILWKESSKYKNFDDEKANWINKQYLRFMPNLSEDEKKFLLFWQGKDCYKRVLDEDCRKAVTGIGMLNILNQETNMKINPFMPFYFKDFVSDLKNIEENVKRDLQNKGIKFMIMLNPNKMRHFLVYDFQPGVMNPENIKIDNIIEKNHFLLNSFNDTIKRTLTHYQPSQKVYSPKKQPIPITVQTSKEDYIRSLIPKINKYQMHNPESVISSKFYNWIGGDCETFNQSNCMKTLNEFDKVSQYYGWAFEPFTPINQLIQRIKQGNSEYYITLSGKRQGRYMYVFPDGSNISYTEISFEDMQLN